MSPGACLERILILVFTNPWRSEMGRQPTRSSNVKCRRNLNNVQHAGGAMTVMLEQKKAQRGADDPKDVYEVVKS